MSRDAAIAAARAMFDDGSFLAILQRRIACPTASQEPGAYPHLMRYLEQEMAPDLERIGFTCTVHPNPSGKGGPFMIARRVEDSGLPTLLTYGHGDVVPGLDKEWHEGLAPWTITERGDRLYGRGIVDNKGQHSANLAALEAVLKVRWKLGFNVTLLLEMSEEVGSPGIDEFARAHRDELKADVLIASDGPRLVPDVPALVLGTRGALALDLRVKYREGGHHSGNWGGLLANPGVRLAHAIASIIDREGRRAGAGFGAERIPQQRPRGAGFVPCRWRGGWAGDQCLVGRARADGGGEGLRLEHLRGAGLPMRPSRRAGECRAAGSLRAVPDPLHR